MDPNIVITIAIVVLCSSIIVFFVQEIGSFIKKIVAVPGMKLLLPLLLASWFIKMYEDWGQWLIMWFSIWLNYSLTKVGSLFPFKHGFILVKIVFLFIISCLPLWLFTARAKYKGIRNPPSKMTYWISVGLWVMGSILLILN